MQTYDKMEAAYADACKSHDGYTKSLALACKRGCFACCTINVVVTSLEASIIADRIDELESKDALWEKVEKATTRKRFKPLVTFNRLADLYSAGQEPPAEEYPDPKWGTCPLLEDGVCAVYDARPLACRALVSGVSCESEGVASVSPLTVSVNTVLIQYVEDIDRAGVSGNMADMLLYMREKRAREEYKKSGALSAQEGFVANSPLRVLMADPAHKEHLYRIIGGLTRFSG